MLRFRLWNSYYHTMLMQNVHYHWILQQSIENLTFTCTKCDSLGHGLSKLTANMCGEMKILVRFYLIVGNYSSLMTAS
jgi:hypothetical protein